MPAAVLVLTWSVTVAGILPSSAQDDNEAAPYTWAGVWDSDFGRLTLDASGSGRYEEGFTPGTVTGEVKPGNILEGTWSQAGDPPKQGPLKFTMSPDGRSFQGDWFYESGGCGSACGWNGTCIEGACLQNGSRPAQDAPAGETLATVDSLSGEVLVTVGGGRQTLLRPGDPLPANAEIVVGVDSRLTMKFPDGSIFEVSELTEFNIASVADETRRREIRLQIKLGKIKASVEKEKVLDTVYELQMPFAAASIRGTAFTVAVDLDAGVTVVSVEEGSVSVDPDAAGLATTIVGAGEEVAVTRMAISDPAAPGTAARQVLERGNNRSDNDDDGGGRSPFLLALALLLVLGLGGGVAFTVARQRR